MRWGKEGSQRIRGGVKSTTMVGTVVESQRETVPNTCLGITSAKE